LSDINIKKLKYSSKHDALIICYDNSNIDIVYQNTIFNFSDIKRKQISGNKQINNILIRDDIAYFSCGFGIVLFDLTKKEIKDTWYIGENANLIQVYDLDTDGINFYAGTEAGLLFAPVTSNNLNDYNSWHKIEYFTNNTDKFTIVEYVNNKLFVNKINSATNLGSVYALNQGTWTNFNSNLTFVNSISGNNNLLILGDVFTLAIYDKNLSLISNINNYKFADNSKPTIKLNDSFVDDNNTIYIADNNYGLVSYIDENTISESFIPDGPLSNIIGRIQTTNSKLYITHGGFRTDMGNNGNPPSYSYFKNNVWTKIKDTITNSIDYYSVLEDKFNPNKIYIGSWGWGVFEYENDIIKNHYDISNSTLQSVIPGNYVRISSMALDNNKNLWVANNDVAKPISVKTAKGEWYSFKLNGTSNAYMTGKIIIDTNNYKWIVGVRGGGLFTFYENETIENIDDDKSKVFAVQTSDGGLSTKNVFCIAQDKNKQIWVGTDEGVVVYNNPENVFSDNFTAERVQLTSFGNDTTEQYLLATDAVTAIAIDGANRKWLGTANSGIFLVSPTGKEGLLNFNMSNSPLPSNNILEIDIFAKTGEVIISTDKGVVSYRGDAIEGKDYFENVYVYPNPIRPNYTGPIAITGLVTDANVKITDVSGNLVFETTALGGQAIWYGKTFSGRKVSTGVYLVFCSNSDGTETFVTKLLFIN